MTLRSNTIHYLDPEVIQNYANVVLISKNGERLRCNSLILAACKSSLVFSFNPDDDTHYMITEFSEIGENLDTTKSIFQWSFRINVTEGLRSA